MSAEAEKVWVFCMKFSELDQEKKAAGNELDECVVKPYFVLISPGFGRTRLK